MQLEAKWPNIDYDAYKLIVSDVDGTLKDVLRPLDPKLRKVISELRKAGVGFTVATGKNMKSTRQTAEGLGVELPLILSNGCVIQDLGGTVYAKHLLPEGFVESLISVCERESIELAIHIGEDIYVREITHNVSILFDYGSPSLIEVEEWKSASDLLRQAYKCIAVDREDRQRLYALEKIIRNLCGKSIEYCHTLVEMLEFMPKRVSKVSGIKTLTDKLNIPISAVLTIGDGNNDIDMLKETGYGLAVADSMKGVKAAADWVIPSCADHGPIRFLNYFLTQIS